MNIIITNKKSKEIKHFIIDALIDEDKKNYHIKGLNKKLIIKKEHVDIYFTTDLIEQIATKENDEEKTVYKQTISDIHLAPIYNGESVGSIDDVDKITVKRIREKYAETDELKILRLKLSGESELFDKYHQEVELIRKESSDFKKIYFP